MDMNDAEHAVLIVQQLKERTESKRKQRSIKAEFARLGQSLKGLADALSRENISIAQVNSYIRSVENGIVGFDLSNLAAEVAEFESRGCRIAELDSALSGYIDPQ